MCQILSVRELRERRGDQIRLDRLRDKIKFKAKELIKELKSLINHSSFLTVFQCASEFFFFVPSLLVILTGFSICRPTLFSFAIWQFVILVEEDSDFFFSVRCRHSVKNVSVRLFHFFYTQQTSSNFDLSNDLGEHYDFLSRCVRHLDFPCTYLGSNVEKFDGFARVDAVS